MATNYGRRRGGGEGFTLIELLVVIAIISVMSSITLFAVVTYRERAQAARVDQEVASFQKAAAIYFAANQRYPNPLTVSNYGSACLPTVGGAPQKCCVSEGGCSYDGETRDTLEGDGDFASAERAPRWLALLGERAEAVLSDTLPRWLTEAPVSENGRFKGVFYDCTDADCTDANVYFTVPKANCSRGTVHNHLGGGVCQQNITAADQASNSEDSCGDSSCDSGEACSADCSTETHCGDNEDNDEDGDADGDDADCETPTESDCADGTDNDNDSEIDCDDADCSSDPACAPSEICDNATDDDSDGDTDCDDADCSSDPACAPSEICDNATDDDSDGDTDCDDGDCSSWSSGYSWSSETSYSYQYCSAGSLQSGSGSGSCADASDNDSDGCTDGTDSDCGGSDSCGDGVDNNCDGNADEGCSTEDCYNSWDDDSDGDTDGCDSECTPGDNGYCA